MFSADLAPDEFANRIGQTLPGGSRIDFAEDGRIAAGVSPGFAGLVFAFKRAEKREHVAAPDRFRELRGRAWLPAERCFELKFFVRRIAISVVARLAAF